MATVLMNPSGTWASFPFWTNTGGSLPTIINDGSDATYTTIAADTAGNIQGKVTAGAITATESVVEIQCIIRADLDGSDLVTLDTSFSNPTLNGPSNIQISGTIGDRQAVFPVSLASTAVLNSLWTGGTTGIVITLGFPSPTDSLSIYKVQVSLRTAATPVPTSVLPVNGGTVTTSRPAVSASIASTGDFLNRPFKRQWQFATDAGFTTGVQTYTDAASAINPSGSMNPSWGSNRLAQGTWYLRCRSVDDAGNTSAWSGTNTFTVAHVPTTGDHAPAAGNFIQYTTTPTLDWTFSDIDPTDSQTKYRVQFWRSADPGTVLDSTELTSVNTFHQFVSGISATWKDNELRWKVYVKDLDGVSSGYSTEKIFWMADPDVIAITYPAPAEVITTPSPLVTWTNTLTSGRTQAQYKVDIYRAAVLVYSSGWVVSSTPSHQVTAPTVTVGPTHTVTVSVIDSVGIVGTMSNNFTATYIAPTNPTYSVSATNFPLKGYYFLDWSASTADAAFYAWRVYRRPAFTGTYALIFETLNVSERTFKDYLAPSLEQVEYAVVQVTVEFATQVESAYDPTAIIAEQLKYILVVPDNDTLNLTLESVKGDKFGDEVEQATMNLVGRGRRVEIGENYGTIGSLTAVFRDNTVTGFTARQQRIAFELLRSSKVRIYLRKPFGDVYEVTLMTGDVTLTPGTGNHEYAEVDIDYVEITD